MPLEPRCAGTLAASSTQQVPSVQRPSLCRAVRGENQDATELREAMLTIGMTAEGGVLRDHLASILMSTGSMDNERAWQMREGQRSFARILLDMMERPDDGSGTGRRENNRSTDE